MALAMMAVVAFQVVFSLVQTYALAFVGGRIVEDTVS